MVAALQIHLIELGIDRAGAREASLFLRRHCSSDLARDHPGDFTLKNKNVVHGFVERPGPQHRPIRSLDQPGMDLQLVPDMLERRLDDSLHASQFRRNLSITFVGPVKLHHRLPAYCADGFDFSQLCYEAFEDPF